MKRTFILTVIMALVLVFSMQAQAALQNLGTDSFNNRLIYDSDLNITWYDFSNPVNTWQNQVNWAGALSVTFGSNTYTDWRLPTALNQNGSGPCSAFNCTGSEMGHLYYTELGNATGGPLSQLGEFQNLQPNNYWLGTEFIGDTNGSAWQFGFNNGWQSVNAKNASLYAIAVRPGLAVAPEPVSSILFVIGGASLGIRRFWKKRMGRPVVGGKIIS